MRSVWAFADHEMTKPSKLKVSEIVKNTNHNLKKEEKAL
jgi:hypothetical protein